MSDPDTSQTLVHIDFAGKTRRFQLRIGEAEELELRCNAGIGAILIRVSSGQFYVADIWSTIELGMIGGGENPIMAGRICKLYRNRNEPLYTYAHIPAMILKSFLMGFESSEDESGNDEAAGLDEQSNPET